MKRIAILLLSIIFLTTCTEEEGIKTRPFARVTTHEVSDISAVGATLIGEITQASVPVIDHGFEFSPQKFFYIGNTIIYSLGEKSGTGRFQERIEAGLAENITYYVRAYAKSGDFVYYGETRELVSLGSKAPVAERIEPAEGTWRDRVVIYGKNFSTIKGEMSVRFGEAVAEITSLSSDSIVTSVPVVLSTSPVDVKVSLRGNATTASQQFTLAAPQISTIEPSSGQPGTLIEITGKGFSPRFTEVYVGNTKILEPTILANSIKFAVPNIGGGATQIRVKSVEGVSDAGTSFFVIAPWVIDVYPLTGIFGEEVLITVANLRTDQSTQVYFNNVSVPVVSVQSGSIVVRIPGNLSHYENVISVVNGTLRLETSFVWSLFPPEIHSIEVVEPFGDYIVITGKNFRPGSNTILLNGILPVSDQGDITMTEIITSVPSGFPGAPLTIEVDVLGQTVAWPHPINLPFARLPTPGRQSSVAPVYLNDKLTIIEASAWNTHNVYTLDGQEYTWKSNVPFDASISTMLFSTDRDAYFLSDMVNEFWKFDAVLNAWTLLTSPLDHATALWTGAFINGKGYAFNSTNGSFDQYEILEYDPASDQWSNVADFSGSFQRQQPFIYNGDMYWVSNNGKLMRFNPESNDVSIFANSPGATYAGQRGDKIYMVKSNAVVEFSMATKNVTRSIQLSYDVVNHHVIDTGTYIYFISANEFYQFNPDFL